MRFLILGKFYLSLMDNFRFERVLLRVDLFFTFDINFVFDIYELVHLLIALFGNLLL